MYKILIITGEPSGDNLGSKLIKEMKIQFDEEVDQKNSQNKKNITDLNKSLMNIQTEKKKLDSFPDLSNSLSSSVEDDFDE